MSGRAFRGQWMRKALSFSLLLSFFKISSAAAYPAGGYPRVHAPAAGSHARPGSGAASVESSDRLGYELLVGRQIGELTRVAALQLL